MNPADITRAISQGHHPHLDPVGFFQAVLRSETRRNRETEDIRIRHLTAGHGYALRKKWQTPSEMLADRNVDPPMWLGEVATVEEWKRGGSDALFVFRARSQEQPTSVFKLRPSGRWVRLV